MTVPKSIIRSCLTESILNVAVSIDNRAYCNEIVVIELMKLILLFLTV